MKNWGWEESGWGYQGEGSQNMGNGTRGAGRTTPRNAVCTMIRLEGVGLVAVDIALVKRSG